MFSDTVNPITQTPAVLRHPRGAKSPAYAAWRQFPHSYISHHGGTCCETARAWFLNMDVSLLGDASALSGPRWIRSRWDWGPSVHPVYWCEAVRASVLDCGALAALAYEAFTGRGVQCFPLQLIERYPADATEHWRDEWSSQNVSVHWIADGLTYHEGSAILLPDHSLQLWDATSACWVNEHQQGGYGSLAALRIHAPEAAASAALRWGALTLMPNNWTSFGEQ